MIQTREHNVGTKFGSLQTRILGYRIESKYGISELDFDKFVDSLTEIDRVVLVESMDGTYQWQIGKMVGITQSAVSNRLRLIGYKYREFNAPRKRKKKGK